MPEHIFIGEIVEQILGTIEPVAIPIGDYLVGLEYQKQHVTSLLNIGSDDTVHMVGSRHFCARDFWVSIH